MATHLGQTGPILERYPSRPPDSTVHPWTFCMGKKAQQFIRKRKQRVQVKTFGQYTLNFDNIKPWTYLSRHFSRAYIPKRLFSAAGGTGLEKKFFVICVNKIICIYIYIYIYINSSLKFEASSCIAYVDTLIRLGV